MPASASASASAPTAKAHGESSDVIVDDGFEVVDLAKMERMTQVSLPQEVYILGTNMLCPRHYRTTPTLSHNPIQRLATWLQVGGHGISIAVSVGFVIMIFTVVTVVRQGAFGS